MTYTQEEAISKLTYWHMSYSEHIFSNIAKKDQVLCLWMLYAIYRHQMDYMLGTKEGELIDMAVMVETTKQFANSSPYPDSMKEALNIILANQIQHL